LIGKIMRRWAPAALMMLAIFLFSSIPSEEMPHFGGWDTALKKAGHMLGYGVFSATCWRGVFGTTKKATLISWLLVFVYAISDEIHQSTVSGRNAAWLDVAIDGMGAAIGLLLVNKSVTIQRFIVYKVV